MINAILGSNKDKKKISFSELINRAKQVTGHQNSTQKEISVNNKQLDKKEAVNLKIKSDTQHSTKTNKNSKNGTQSNNSKVTVAPKPQPQLASTHTKPKPRTKNTTNTSVLPQKGTTPSDPSATKTNNPKTDAKPNPQSIDKPQNPTLERSKAPDIQPQIKQISQVVRKSIDEMIEKYGKRRIMTECIGAFHEMRQQERHDLKRKKYWYELQNHIETMQTESLDEDQKRLDDQEQVKSLLKKNKEELKKNCDLMYGASLISPFIELSPYIAKVDNLNTNFVENLCEQIRQITQTYEQYSKNLEMLQISFMRLLDPQVLQAFRDHINDYFQQIQAAPGDEALQTRIEERLQAFVYNFLVPPYQEPNEGSCFATAFLMNMWYNSPIDYMRFIRWAVDTDEPFDLAKIGGKGIIDLRILRKGDPRTAIKRILVAIVASLDKSVSRSDILMLAKQVSSIVVNETKNDKNISTREAFIFALKLLGQGVVYIDNELLPVCVLKQYEEKRIDVSNRIIESIKNKLSTTNLSTASRIATHVLTDARLRDPGGLSGVIVQNWGEGQRFEGKTITFKKPIENGIFTEEQFKPLSDALKGGEKGKFAIISLEYQNKEGKPDDAHTCNVVIDDSYETMQPGESRKFINLNYLDNIHSSSWVQIEKTTPNGYQIKRNGVPFNRIISSVEVYPTFEAKIMRHPV